MNTIIACFLLFNVKTQQLEKTIGKVNCEQQLPAASTFKVPLAVMAFDSGVLKDENQILKWDGKKRWNPEWNKDQDAKSWMKYSVVWFSQQITPKLGMKKADHYLKQFEYGTESLAPGLTTAWLNSPLDPKGALKISAYEQLEFMKKLWSDKLPVSKRSMEITRKITYLETSPNGFQLSGKTGTNNYTDKKKMEIGWFIAHIQKGDKEYISVYNFRQERKPDSEYAGPRAREITKELLKKESLW